jgi:hypothetical protein
MEYGLRRYEATNRLLWFVFFLLCLGLAYPAAQTYGRGDAGTFLCAAFHPEVLKSSAFWLRLHWAEAAPFGWTIAFMFWAAIFFLFGKLLWLLVQFTGKFLAAQTLVKTLRAHESIPKPPADEAASTPERFFPAALLLQRVDQLLPQLLFHPFKRLKLLLSKPQGMLSSEGLIEKERRISDTDWEILRGSWTPLRWLLWLLPILGATQAAWITYNLLSPAFYGQAELQTVVGAVPMSLLPLFQIVAATVVFRITGLLLKRFEDLYLSNVDSLFYDQLLSKLPFQSGDTVIILDALQRHFREIQISLRKLERLASERKLEGYEVERQ